jgi:hypothetical protein
VSYSVIIRETFSFSRQQQILHGNTAKYYTERGDREKEGEIGTEDRENGMPSLILFVNG